MKALKILALFFIFGSVILPRAHADRLDDLSRRVKELEKEQAELELEAAEAPRKANSFFDDKLTLGGFFEPSATALTGPNTSTQVANSTELLGINLSASFGPRLKFVSQFITGLAFPLTNPNNDSNATTLGLPQTREFGSLLYGALLPEGFIEHDITDSLQIEGGLGYVPFGYILQLREPVLYVRREGAQLATIPTLVSPLWSGINLSADYPTGVGHWGFNVYTFTPIFNPKVAGMGGRMWWSLPNDRLTLGASTQIGKQSGDTYKAVGADIRLIKKPLTLTAEYARRLTAGHDPWSAYVEPDIFIYKEELLLFLAADFARNTQNVTGVGAHSLPDPYDKWEYGAGFNWLPTSYVRVRLEVYYNDYVGTALSSNGQSRNYVSIDSSAGITF